MSINEGNKQKKFFYGWVIVAVCLLVQAVPFGVGSNLPPTFINYVVKAEGFSFASFSLMFTIGTIISAVCSPFIGKLFTKVNVKILYIIASILVGVGFMAFAFAGNHLVAYYILAGIVQIGVATMSSIGVPTLINSWFKVNKGSAMGIAFAGGGLGNVFLQMIAGKWLADPAIGYKGAYIRFGAIALVISLILSIFFVRMPKSKEELEANIPKKKKDDEKAIHHISWGYTISEVTKMPQFWLIGIAFIFVGFYVAGIALQFIAYLQNLEEAGTLLIPAATIASLFGLFSIFGTILGGMLFDKFGLSKSYAFSGILVVIACLCLIFIPNMNYLGYIFPICFGISMFSYIMGPSYMTGALFGDREYSAILGIIQIFFALGFAIGSPIFGAVIDKFGWTTGWISTTIYAIIAYVGLIISCSMILKINKENNVTETKRIS
ncbi:conjugated bile salt MFS transporter [Romboutsia ilealis]|uniref:conjugated bile salt MFS transporter n=1 Tax=Romboutsia ilealis TaxID=1115758 RepID=UPI0025B73EE0|nr:conjugated bile salt MFS transporter [Romboutsia ilealis]